MSSIIMITNLIITILITVSISPSSSFKPTKNVHLSCKKFFEYILVIDCQLPSDLQQNEIAKITSKNITSSLPLKISATNMPEHFPQGIGDLFPDIEELRIWFADVKFIDRESFANLRDLKVLDLIGNSIENIPKDSFYDLNNLEEINLSQNHLKSLESDLLVENLKLKKFSAEKNEIEIIPSGFFRNNLGILEINFDRNKIKTIEIDFNELVNVKRVGLSGNFGECNFNFNRKEMELVDFQENVEKFCK